MADTTVNRGYPLMADNEGDKPQAVNDAIVAIDEDVATFGAPAWGDITGKPSTFAPSAHAASHANGGSDEVALDASQVTSGVFLVARTPADSAATANKLMLRDANGRSKAADPVASDDVATKNYVLSQVSGGINYQGTWNANTNSPALANGVGTAGYYYKVATAGTTAIDGQSDWNVGDWIIFNGVAWDKVDNSEEDATSSVKGRIQLAGNLSGNAAAPSVTSLTFPAALVLALGAIADGEFLKRNGPSLEGAPGSSSKYATDVGNGSATSFAITHNLGTKDLSNVLIYENFSSYNVVQPSSVSINTTNQITVVFASAPSAGQYRVVVTA